MVAADETINVWLLFTYTLLEKFGRISLYVTDDAIEKL